MSLMNASAGSFNSNFRWLTGAPNVLTHLRMRLDGRRRLGTKERPRRVLRTVLHAGAVNDHLKLECRYRVPHLLQPNGPEGTPVCFPDCSMGDWRHGRAFKAWGPRNAL